MHETINKHARGSGSLAPRSALTIVILFACISSTFAQFSFEGVVVSIADGDTVSVKAGQKVFKLRLHGIDAPERGQDFGTKAKEALAAGIAGKMVLVHVRDIDRYGRIVAELFCDDVNWGLKLLEEGLAWHYTAYDSSAVYAEAEARARQARRGLWSKPGPVPPWEYRKKS